MSGDEELRGELHGLLVVMASLAHGLETVLGRGAAPITFRSGRAIGLKSEVKETSTDLLKAVELVQEDMATRGVIWPCEPWKPESESNFVFEHEGKPAVRLVFRNCMVRCSLFRYSHEQKLSLCLMNHGFFCGTMQKILGKRVNLEILHAGENACLKVLTVEG